MKQGFALLLTIILAALIMIALWIWQADNLLPSSEIRNLKAINDISTSSNSANPVSDKINNTQKATEDYNNQLINEMK